MTSASSHTMSSASISDTVFYNYLEDSYNQSIVPFKTTHNGHDVYYYVKVYYPGYNGCLVRPKEQSILDYIYDLHKCNTCKQHAKHLIPIVDSKGPIFCRHQTADTTDYHKTMRGMVLDYYKEHMKMSNFNNFDFVISASHDVSYMPLVSGKSKDGTEVYKHYAYSSTYITERNDDTNKLKLAFNKYSSLIKNLLSRFNCMEGLMTSLNLSLKIIDVSTYAHKIKSAVLWLKGIIELIITKYEGKALDRMSPISCIEIIAFAITSSTISYDHDDTVVITYFSQINNNMLNILEKAKSEQAMKKMLEDRFSPLKYQRPTTDATPQQLKRAIDSIGNFTNTIYTVEELEELEGCFKVGNVTPSKTETSSKSGFDALLQKSKPVGKYGFASRCDSFYHRNYGTYEKPLPRKPKNLAELIEDCKHYTHLELYVSGMSPVFVAKTTLDEDKRCVPYFWSFMNGNHAFTAVNDLCKITHIHHIKVNTHNNVMFVVNNSYESTHLIKKNCNYPEFLSTKFNVHKKSFENLNEVTKVGIPGGKQQIAYGVGVSVINAQNSLNKSISFRINRSITVSFTHYS